MWQGTTTNTEFSPGTTKPWLNYEVRFTKEPTSLLICKQTFKQQVNGYQLVNIDRRKNNIISYYSDN